MLNRISVPGTGIHLRLVFAMRHKFHAHEMRFPRALTACIVKKPMLFGPEGIFFVVVVLDRF